ncbi:MAG: DUF1573 domain-containing protein [Desulfobacteraceae bacterium]|nr:DUF1573 domain-containing protein [Desulfobacteraceae bacterium]
MKRLGVAAWMVLFFVAGCAHQGSSGSFFQRFLAFCHIASPQKAKTAEVCLLDPASYIPEPSAAPASQDKPPVAEVPVTSHDFGNLSESDDYIHKFRVRNTGKSILNIKKVVPG